MISLKKAFSLVTAIGSVAQAQQVKVDNALGMILAQNISASENIPSFKTSAMDGYAVKISDLNNGINKLKVVGKVFAGDVFDSVLETGQTIRIMTGACIPEGADAVCPQEYIETQDEDNLIYIPTVLCENENIRSPGEDVKTGQKILTKGQKIEPAHIGVLKSLGINSVSVIPPIKVGVITTGNELTESLVLKPGQIRDSNRPAIIASLKELGALPVDFGIVNDKLEEIQNKFLEAALQCDLLITSGGVSVGEADFIAQVLNKICDGNMQSIKISIKPGKPLEFGVVKKNNIPLIALPGNPVACLVSFHIFAKALIKKMMGFEVNDIKSLKAVANSDFDRYPDGKIHLDRGLLQFGSNGQLNVIRQINQGSHLLRLFSESNVLIVIPDGNGIKKGELAEVIPLCDTCLFA